MSDIKAAAITDQPGRPYYEKLRATLRDTITKKRVIDEQLAVLEENIYKLEGNYLEETNGAGNIVKGFDNWVKGVVVGNDRRGDDRKGRVRARDEDRIFSRSSMSWLKSQETPSATPAASSPAPSAQTPAPTSTTTIKVVTANKAGAARKKSLAAEKADDEDEGKPAKRTKISHGARSAAA